MKEVAMWCGVSMNALVYFMRKHKIKRRTLKEASAMKFAQKPLSYSKKEILTSDEEELRIAGIMLYWAEGTKSKNYGSIDFANSDPYMVLLFLDFLRRIFRVDENRLRIYLYCYSDQSPPELISYWSQLSDIPKEQFSKPYVRTDFRKNGRKMLHGLIHVRYNDKKLWQEIMDMIEEYKIKICVGGRVV